MRLDARLGLRSTIPSWSPPMLKKTMLAKSLLIAFSGGATMSVGVAFAQAVPQELQRVEITGSAIKRAASETALPIQVITKKDIERSGVTNTNDLLQRLPAMQNSTVEGSAVGGETFGFGGVSIHNIGETRTLVLLNGKRVAKFGGQTVTGALNGIDLNTLPISAIERVEVLTDGASALYGADAVAGVVNFITKKSGGDGTLSAGASQTKDGGAAEKRISITKGFGEIDSDGYNFSFALSYDKRGTLAATQREFAKTGLVSYTDENGEILSADTNAATSKRSIPANLNLYNAAGGLVKRINPALAANGQCPPNHVQSGLSCRFDYTSQLEVYPDRERLSGYTSFEKSLGNGATWFTEALIGKTKSTARIAPPPGELPIQPGTAAYDQAIALAKSKGYYPTGIIPGVGDPALVKNFDPSTMDANLRFSELGKRTNINEISIFHFTTGVEGKVQDWDYGVSLIHSENTAKDTFGGGYASVSGVVAATFSPFNPLLPLGQQSAAGQKAIDNAKIEGYWNGGKSSLDAVNLKASRELVQLSGGPLQMAVGGSFQRERLDARTGDILGGRVTYPADANGAPCSATGLPCVGTGIDQRFGDSGIQPAYKASRNTWGVFTELGAPVTKELELTASVRFDKTSDFGTSLNGKLAARYQPVKDLLIRGSIGTGYIAPSLAQVNAPEQNYGVTGNPYSCSPALQAIADQKGVTCDDGAQFQQFAKGFSGLQPEKSKQATLGVLWDATQNFSVGADFWTVLIRNAIGQISEQVVFADPTKYSRYFSTFTDPATGKKLLSVTFPNENLGKSATSGIDFSTTGKLNVGPGKLTSNLIATLLLKSEAQAEKDGVYFSDISNKDQQSAISFRWKGKFINTYDVGAWSNTIVTNFMSGYTDSATSPNITTGVNAGSVKADYRVEVGSYITFDWASTYAFTKAFSLNGGVLNIADKHPPFVFSQGGASRGQEVGWDGRYYDPRGRTFYINGNYKF